MEKVAKIIIPSSKTICITITDDSAMNKPGINFFKIMKHDTDTITDESNSEFHFLNNEIVVTDEKENIFYEMLDKIKRDEFKNILDVEEYPMPLDEKQKNMIHFLSVSLENDSRVKEHEILYDKINIKFYNLNDSLSFYRQYSLYFDVKFLTDDFFEIEEPGDSSIFNFPGIKSKIIEAGEPKKEFNKLEYIKDPFLQKVEYLNTCKKIYCSFDVKIFSDMVKNRDIDFIFNAGPEILVGANTNMVVQEAIRIMSLEELELFIEKIGIHFGAISCTKYGAYVTQSIFSKDLNQTINDLLFKWTEDDAYDIFIHPVGNYTMQKILINDSNVLFNFYEKFEKKLLTNNFGLKIFKKCIIHFKNEQRAAKLLKKILLINNKM
ncbi:hypothetical protein SLOPH_2264 [Spraguea lophii 42_110]|uniref:Uncharacterized protein n=1 Tax=Spraguea lophii (strain 42_110) TaxID=1358809 RepID=S7WAG6_SPRLO|nr:hypothetical protein SLOPH_2264 [Spraguea lophii 42_110]